MMRRILWPVLVLAIACVWLAPAGGREVVCSQPGNLDSAKIPADTLEVANNCDAAGPVLIVKARWWGGYIDWLPGDPEVTRFAVRFYGDSECSPLGLLAEYPDATPDITPLGPCGDGLPCFLYELDVGVVVGPEPFWMSVQALWDYDYPPKWGRLGDEAADDCGSQAGGAADGWDMVAIPGWDASQEFEIGITPAGRGTWSAVKSRY